MAFEAETTVTTKGQVTIPANIREKLDLQPGDKLRFSLSDAGELTIEPRRQRSIFDQIERLSLPPLGRPLAQRDIDDATAAAMLEQEHRIRRHRKS